MTTSANEIFSDIKSCVHITTIYLRIQLGKTKTFPCFKQNALSF